MVLVFVVFASSCLYGYIIAFLCSGDAKEMQPDWPPAGHLKGTSWERLKVVSDFELSPCNP